MDKYGMVDQIVVWVDSLIDARGIEKCRLAVNIISLLSDLKEGLRREDAEKETKEVEEE